MRSAIDRLADRLRDLSGWKRWALAFALGGVATLALPPVDLLPAVVLSITALVWQIAADRPDPRRGFWLGWWFGFGYFVFGLYWIGNALLVFASQHAWMLPFAAFGLPAFLALFTGLAGLLAGFGRGRLSSALLLAGGLAATDWLRGHVLTGLPWNLFGHSWSGIDAFLQPAALYGVYGLGLLALLVAALPAAVASGSVRRRIAAGGMSVVLLVGHFGFGMWRLGMEVPAPVSDVGLRLVQANIPQREKWARRYRGRNLGLHYRLSVVDRPDWITHVIWPEMAATLFLADDPEARNALAQAAPPDGLLITGAPRRDTASGRAFNSILALDRAGRVVGSYDKAHLVPFGEYVPLASILPLEKITQGALGYRAGAGVRTLRFAGLPGVSFLVCYEVIFSGDVIDPADPPTAIINLTNDAWYGATAGPHQHFANARIRAVEEGVPVVRAAYTGISGVFDPFGRVQGTIPLETEGYLDVRLPGALQTATVFRRFGDLPFAVFLVLVLLAGVLARRAEPHPEGQNA